MTHQKTLRTLSCLLDGELDSQTRELTLKHLETCDSCRMEYEDLQKLQGFSADLKTLVPEGPSACFETRLKARLEESRTAPAGFIGRRLPALAVLSAAFVFLFIIGSTFGSFAVALDRQDPVVREKIITATVGKIAARPSVLNLVTIMNFCHECHSAICATCGQCPPGAPVRNCCPADPDREKTHE